MIPHLASPVAARRPFASKPCSTSSADLSTSAAHACFAGDVEEQPSLRMAIASLGFASGCSAKGGPWGGDHTSHQVRFEGAAVIELMNTLVKVEEGILDDVLGQGFVLGDDKRGPNGPHLVVAHQ